MWDVWDASIQWQEMFLCAVHLWSNFSFVTQ